MTNYELRIKLLMKSGNMIQEKSYSFALHVGTIQKTIISKYTVDNS